MTRSRGMVLVAAALLGLALASGCESAERTRARQEAVDTLTRRQRDSLLSTMPVPGASAVGRAMRAADSAAARARAHDTIR